MRDKLTEKIETAVLAHLVENGSFSSQEIYDSITGKDRKFRKLWNSLSRDYSEYGIAEAYEQYVRTRVRVWIAQKNQSGDRIFIGIPVNGSTHQQGVRYVMRMDATDEQLRKAGYHTLTTAMQTLRKGTEHVIAANTIEADGRPNLNSYTPEEYDAVNERIHADAEHVLRRLEITTNTAVTALSGVKDSLRLVESPKDDS